MSGAKSFIEKELLLSFVGEEAVCAMSFAIAVSSTVENRPAEDWLPAAWLRLYWFNASALAACLVLSIKSGTSSLVYLNMRFRIVLLNTLFSHANGFDVEHTGGGVKGDGAAVGAKNILRENGNTQLAKHLPAGLYIALTHLQ